MKKAFFQPVDPKKPLPKTEQEMLAFWEREKIFEKSVQQRRGKPKYVFFDGPPFANGLPHYGHILANALKDAVTRYWNMRGYCVPRVNGWDCHGLPVEYEIEKELKISGRKQIERMGVAKFNKACRQSVFRYTEEWEKLLRRIARWVDFEHSYATLDNNYMETIWWVFKEIWKKKMVYAGHKSMHICWRCETPLSNFEVTLGYKDVVDLAVTVKFPLLGEPRTYLLAWTTTPWTLPAHTFINVGPEIEYVKVKCGGDFYIVARAALERNFKDKPHEVVETLTAKDLEGKRYEPPFPYYKGWKNAFQVFIHPDVIATEGTGLVHMSPAFGGEEEVAFMRSKNIEPMIHVNLDGTFTKEISDYAGKIAKAEVHHIKEHLEKEGKLFSFENYTHSYPHCWRCDTPLLAYLTKAWFIKVTELKEKLLKNNRKIHWVPEHIKDGRFGKWLEGARDWNISRNRFWGCPIPVWQCENGHTECIGSLKELREKSLGGNTFYLVRHGEAQQNKDNILNSDPTKNFRLTKEGITQVKRAAAQLREKIVDLIFSSQFPRATQTAEIFSEALGVAATVDDRLREHDIGAFEGKDAQSYVRTFADVEERYFRKPNGGESFAEMEQRAIEFINYLNRKYSGKRIVVVTHGDVIRALARYFDRLSLEETFAFKPGLAAVYEYRAGSLPLREGQLDLHKPYIDEVQLVCGECAKPMRRIPEVLDCWFESGAMPYAQLHYPFENRKEFEENFPAHFIAEGLDQTRGWFYTLHVLATILFDKPAFNNVIVNGILLAADGEKLSKRKKNYPDPSALFETHGADSTRLFLYTSTTPLGEDARFSEKHVEEIVKKFTLTLWNTYSFFVTYANIDGWKPQEAGLPRPPRQTRNDPPNKLDQWILSELHALIAEVTAAMDGYNLTAATRPLLDFVDNLSNWYVRRSRRRFWKSENDRDKSQAYETLHTVLQTLCLLLAPFMPLTADAVYKNLTGRESVHLEDWPKSDSQQIKKSLHEEIRTVRIIVSLALKLRARKNIKVRQPLAKLVLTLPGRVPQNMIESYRDVILEELNVKELAFESEGKMATVSISVDSRKIGPKFGPQTQEIIAMARRGDFATAPDGSVHFPANGKSRYVLAADEVVVGYLGNAGFDVESEGGILVGLDTTVTETLQQEGLVRDIIRHLQQLRKKAGYSLADRIYVFVSGPKPVKEAVTRFADFLERETLALEVQEGGDFEWDQEMDVEIDGSKVRLGVRK